MTGDCPRSSDGLHVMRDWQTGGKLIRSISLCAECFAVDGAALDRWAEQSFKEQMNRRSQQIALAAGTEPFAFVQATGQDLTLEDVLLQALGAATTLGAELGATGHASTGQRETAIYKALLAEVSRFQQMAALEGAQKAESQIEPDVKAWMDLAHELYALACNSSPKNGYNDDMKADWQGAFVRLRDRFHELLPELLPALKAEAG